MMAIHFVPALICLLAAISLVHSSRTRSPTRVNSRNTANGNQNQNLFAGQDIGQGVNLDLNPFRASANAVRGVNGLVNVGYHGAAKPLGLGLAKAGSKLITAPLGLLLRPINAQDAPDAFVDSILDIGTAVSDAVVATKDNLVDIKANTLDAVGGYTDGVANSLQSTALETGQLAENVFNNGLNQLNPSLNENDGNTSRRRRRSSNGQGGQRRSSSGRKSRRSSQNGNGTGTPAAAQQPTGTTTV